MMRIPTYGQFETEAESISEQMNSMSSLYNEASSGQKIQHGSQDPVLASQIYSTQEYINQIQSYSTNGTLAQSNNTQVASAMQNALASLSSVVSYLDKTGGTMNAQQIQNTVGQLQGSLTTLLNIANSQDGSGNYLFSGSSTDIQPYTEVNGSYQYQGGMTPMTLGVAPDVSVTNYDSGFNVFGNIYNGNGTFSIGAGSSNTGTASTDPGAVVSTSSYVPDTYTLAFSQNAQGQTVYQVTGASSGTVVPSTVYTGDGASLSFNGISFNVSGTPNPGDTFTIQPSTQQNVFNTIQNLINACSNAAPGNGNFKQIISQTSAALSQASSHLLNYQTQVGSTGQVINKQLTSNSSSVVEYKTTLSHLADADMVQVFSSLMQQSTALQATQSSYLQLQKTLMDLLKG